MQLRDLAVLRGCLRARRCSCLRRVYRCCRCPSTARHVLLRQADAFVSISCVFDCVDPARIASLMPAVPCVCATTLSPTCARRQRRPSFLPAHLLLPRLGVAQNTPPGADLDHLRRTCARSAPSGAPVRDCGVVRALLVHRRREEGRIAMAAVAANAYAAVTRADDHLAGVDRTRRPTSFRHRHRRAAPCEPPAAVRARAARSARPETSPNCVACSRRSRIGIEMTCMSISPGSRVKSRDRGAGCLWLRRWFPVVRDFAMRRCGPPPARCAGCGRCARQAGDRR